MSAAVLQEPVVSHHRIYFVRRNQFSLVVRRLIKVLDPSKHELMLIAPRPQFAYLPTALRVLVDKRTPINTMFMSYDSIFGTFPGELKLGCVSSIDENMSGQGGRVVLKTGEQIAYDVLAVATGSTWQGLLAFPDKQALYEEHIQLWREKFEKAQNIVIVGGGAVGIGLPVTILVFVWLTMF